MEKEIIKTFKELNTILQKKSVPFWLNRATLLSAVRDKKFIDYDIDLCIFRKDLFKFKKVVPCLTKKGFDVKISHRNIIIKKGNFESGFGIYDINGEIVSFTAPYHYTNIVTKPLYYLVLSKFNFTEKYRNFFYFFFKLFGSFYVKHGMPREYITPLNISSFYGISVYTPNDLDGYLSLFYGKEWKTPDPTFPHKPTVKDYKGFKNTWRKVLVECKKCGFAFFVDNPHKKGDGAGQFITINVKCKRCGKVWKEKIFVVGRVMKRL